MLNQSQALQLCNIHEQNHNLYNIHEFHNIQWFTDKNHNLQNVHGQKNKNKTHTQKTIFTTIKNLQTTPISMYVLLYYDTWT